MSQLREQLLGYLLGALEEHEIREIEKKLAESPQVRGELESLKVALFPLESLREEFEPSGDLAERTCQWVASQSTTGATPAPPLTSLEHAPTVPNRPFAAGGSIVRRSPNWLDAFVSVGVCTTLALLFFPTLLNLREQARRNYCQANLRQIGMGIEVYHTRFGSIPYIPLHGPFAFAGYYAPALRDFEMLESDCRLICPGSEVAAHRNGFCVPTREMLQQARPNELARLRCRAGGSYGFHLGVFFNARHCALVLNNRSQSVIMTDAPDYHRPNFVSSHHGGQGINVLYADMRCAFIRGCEILGPNGRDNVFLNSEGHIAAGIGYADSVIAPSGMTPRVISVSLSTQPWHMGP